MRIAYVTVDPGVPVFGQKGCSIHVREVLQALAKGGAQIDLFSTNCAGEPPAALAGLHLHALPRIPKAEPAAREKSCIGLNEDLKARLERHGPVDLVYERYSLWGFAGMEYAQRMGIPGLLEVNAPLIEEQAQYRVLVDRAGAERVAERVLGAATALLAVSEEVAEYLERYPAARGKVHVVPNGVNPERFSGLPPRKVQGGSLGTFTVGFVGTLKAWHGVAILVEAFALLHRRHPYARLLIVGDGPERERLSADVAARGLADAVHFTGAVASDEVPAKLASMDVAVAPYPRLEHFYFSPLKVYEYMAAGLPVVASAIGQLEKLITPGVNGLLVPPGAATTLAEALERLCGDPELRTRLGLAARAKVLAEHTWDAVAERILRIAGLELPAYGA